MLMKKTSSRTLLGSSPLVEERYKKNLWGNNVNHSWLKDEENNHSHNTMDIYEQTLSQLVQSDSRVKELIVADRDFRWCCWCSLSWWRSLLCDRLYQVEPFYRSNHFCRIRVWGHTTRCQRGVSTTVVQTDEVTQYLGFNAFGTRPSEEVLNNHQRWSQERMKTFSQFGIQAIVLQGGYLRSNLRRRRDLKTRMGQSKRNKRQKKIESLSRSDHWISGHPPTTLRKEWRKKA